MPGSLGSDEAVPTAFVSYARSDPSWEETVLEFATALRTIGGVDADIDRWHQVIGDWTAFGPAALKASEFVLLAVSQSYREVWEGASPPERHAGVAMEASVVKALLHPRMSDETRRVIVVLLPGVNRSSIPEDLLGVETVDVTSLDEAGLDPLLRSMLGRPRYVHAPLGPLPALPLYVANAIRAESSVDDDPGVHGASGTLAAGDDRALVDVLAMRLAQIEAEITAGGSDTRLHEERSALKAALQAVERVLLDALDRAFPARAESGPVFLSYSHHDEPSARQLSKALADRGIETWLAGDEISTSDNVSELIGKRLRTASMVVLLIGRHPSAWVRYEWSQALLASWDRDVAVVPVVLDDAEPPTFLRGREVLRVHRAVSSAWEDAAQRLPLSAVSSRRMSAAQAARLSARWAQISEAASALPREPTAPS